MSGNSQLRLATMLLSGLLLAACSGPAYVDRSEGNPGLLARTLGPVVFEVRAHAARLHSGASL